MTGAIGNIMAAVTVDLIPRQPENNQIEEDKIGISQKEIYQHNFKQKVMAPVYKIEIIGRGEPLP
jgi:hypothetical protein